MSDIPNNSGLKINLIMHKMARSIWHILEHIIRFFMQIILTVLHVDWTEEKWKNFMQFAKFALVGFSNTAVSYSINVTVIFLLRGIQFEFDYIIANISGFSLSVLWSFYWNNRYVFTLRHGEKRSKWKTLLKTYAVYGLSGLVLNNILSTIWIRIIGLSRYIAPLLNLPITVPVNFTMNKLWAYNTKKKKEEKVEIW